MLLQALQAMHSVEVEVLADFILRLTFIENSEQSGKLPQDSHSERTSLHKRLLIQ